MAELNVDWEDAVFVGRDDIIEYNAANILPQEEEIIAQIRAWLCPTDFDGEGSEYHKHLASHLAGTGSWFLNSSTYKQWHDSEQHGLLWLRGIALPRFRV